MKKCSKCKEVKDYSEFGKNKSMADGHNHYCRVCCAKKYQANKERYQQRYLENAEKYKQYQRDNYARKKGVKK